MSVCHHTLFDFLSAIHSNVQNRSFLYFNCIRIIYAHSMFFFSMRLIASLVLEMLSLQSLSSHLKNLRSLLCLIVLCCEFIYFIIFAEVPKKNATNFFKMPSEVLNLADKQSFIYMFIKLNVKCLSGWLALIWFSILPNIVKFWFMSKSNASPFLTVKLTTLGQCLASKQDWLIYVYQIVYSYTFIHYA